MILRLPDVYRPQTGCSPVVVLGLRREELVLLAPLRALAFPCPCLENLKLGMSKGYITRRHRKELRQGTWATTFEIT